MSAWHLRTLTPTTVFDTPGVSQNISIFNDEFVSLSRYFVNLNICLTCACCLGILVWLLDDNITYLYLTLYFNLGRGAHS